LAFIVYTPSRVTAAILRPSGDHTGIPPRPMCAHFHTDFGVMSSPAVVINLIPHDLV